MTDAPFAVYANDVDLRSLDFWCGVPAGLRGMERRDGMADLLGRAGSIVVAPESTLPPRTFTLDGKLICSSAAQARSRWASIHDLFAGTVELRCDPFPDLVLRVRASRIQDTPQGNIQNGWAAALDLLAPDPFWYDRVPCLYVCPNGVAVPLEPGSGPSGVTLVLYGPATDPTVDLLTPGGGGTGQQAEFTGSIPDGGLWEMDPIEQEIVAVAANGTRTSSPGVLTYGNYIVLDPLMGTGDAAGYPAIRFTGCDGMALVRRAWR